MTITEYLGQITSAKELIHAQLDRLDRATVLGLPTVQPGEGCTPASALDLLAGADLRQAVVDLQAMTLTSAARTLDDPRALNAPGDQT